jgi:hypothetical protein
MSEQMVKELNEIWESTEKRLIALSGAQTAKYTFWLYDVWGNNEDGYNVNDRRSIRENIEIDDPADDSDVLNVLSENGIISDQDKDKLVIDNGSSDDETIQLVFADDEKPFGQLVKDDDEYTSDIGTFLSEDVLEIKREQYLSNGKWQTSFYTLVTGTGGPHTEFTTNGLICVYWGGEKREFTTYDKDAISAIEQIEDYLNETSEE